MSVAKRRMLKQMWGKSSRDIIRNGTFARHGRVALTEDKMRDNRLDMSIID